jgi:dTDP-4-amino-4,6-dideoxygalactose transaminase
MGLAAAAGADHGTAPGRANRRTDDHDPRIYQGASIWHHARVKFAAVPARIAPVDLAAEHRALAHDIEAAALRVLRSGSYVLGAEVAAFEAELARWLDPVRPPHVVACASGTDALTLALLAIGVQPGDEVIVPAFTIFVDSEVVSLLGATPRFVDVEPTTCGLDVRHVARALGSRTRAVIATHLYGVPTDVDALRALCAPRGIAVVEDACQAIGARLHGRAAATLGDFGCLSFFPTKNLGACGDGGAVVVADDHRARVLRELRSHGASAKYHHVRVGLNSRLDELQAAILRVKLGHVGARQARRAAIAARYDAALVPLGLAPPTPPAGHAANHHQYTLRDHDRDGLRAHLAARGIDASVHYPLAAFQQPLYRAAHADREFPVAARLAAEVLSLPIHPELSDHDVDRVVDAVREARDAAPRRAVGDARA